MPRTATATKQPAEPPSLLNRIEKFLGVHGLRSDEDLVKLVEDRLPAGTIGHLVRAGFSENEIYALIVPRRTLTHRRARKEPLSVDESDRAIRIARIAALGEQVFGEPERAWRWLRKPKRQFNGRNPFQMLETETGARLVEELLYAIDDGMAA